MHLVANSALAWIGFCAFILAMLAIDLGVFNRRPHEIGYKDAGIWSAVWVSLALIFAALLFGPLGWELFGVARHQKAIEFLTGYLIELSLSVDNLFVFVLIFSYFKVPSKYQHRVLYWGVLGALVMRVAMILAGTVLLNRFHWIIYIFGAFLIYTSVQMFSEKETEIEPEKGFFVRLVTRHVPIARHYERRKFFTVVDGRRVGTLLLLVLIVVEVTDLVFAVDSIPAIFGVTHPGRGQPRSHLRRHDAVADADQRHVVEERSALAGLPGGRLAGGHQRLERPLRQYERARRERRPFAADQHRGSRREGGARPLRRLLLHDGLPRRLPDVGCDRRRDLAGCP